MKKAKTYVFSILLALTVGGLSALATANNMNIYDKINMPALSPPGWLFPIVWTILFVLMGISAAMIFTDTDGQRYLLMHSPNAPVNGRFETPVFIPIREENGTLVLVDN